MRGTALLSTALTSYVAFQKLDRNYVSFWKLTSPLYQLCLKNQVHSAAEYLRLTKSSQICVASVRQSLVEDKRTTHREHVETKQDIVRLKPKHIVIDRTEAQRNKFKGQVAKLSYQFSGLSDFTVHRPRYLYCTTVW